MGVPASSRLPLGSTPTIDPILTLVTGTRTSSTLPVSRSTWIRADLVPDDEWTPVRETKVFHWGIFTDWHTEAKCKKVSVKEADDLFFGESEDESKTTMTVSKLREVKAFCSTCPVWETCLRHSLTQPERHGVWAGTSKRARLRILALIELGNTTVDRVVDDYKEGREKKYESIRYSE